MTAFRRAGLPLRLVAITLLLAPGALVAAEGADETPAAPASAVPAATDAACTPLTPYDGRAMEEIGDGAALGSAPVQVGRIDVHGLPVFDPEDPEQDLWLYRQANRFRAWAGLDTRPDTIEELLFFREGETVSPRRIAESERELRAHHNLYDARILPKQRCGERVDFDVVTRDLWTLLPRLDITRSGGFSNFGIGVVDSNLFGLGKRLSAGYRETVDRKGWDASWIDPNFLGSHHSLVAALGDSDDGYVQILRVGLPFYSFESRFAWGLSLERTQREEPLYFRGDKFAEFGRRTELVNAFVGWSPGIVGGQQPRFRVGVVHEEHRFARTEDGFSPLPFPADRVFDYPYVAFESVEDDFELTRNLDRLQRTEDLYTGRRFAAQLGYSTQGANRYLYRVEFADAQHFSERTILRYALVAEGAWRLDIDEPENLEVRATARIRDQQSAHWSLSGSVSYVYTDNLTPDRQLLLGGDTGLRGYPLRYQLGDRRFLLSVEERYFSDLHIAKLVRVGGAVFADVGRAWFPSESSEDEFGVLANVGVGLRLESTRTQNGAVIHADLAFPLIDGPEVDPVQFVISVKQSL
jgi:hypothetical protein